MSIYMALVKFFRMKRINRIQRYHLLKKVLLVCIIVIPLYFIIENQRFSNVGKFSNIRQSNIQFLLKTQDREQIKRKERISDVCLKEMKNSRNLQVAAGRFLFYSPLRLSYCVVAKAGCSFWISIMRILLKDFSTNLTKKYPMDMTKMEAHGPRKRMRHLYRMKGYDILLNSTLFFFTRNPYTRLFSGYIDKVMLPELWHSLNKHMAKLTRKRTPINRNCVTDITFSEFLQYVVHSENTYRERNGHWIPIYKTCNPCMWDFKFIGKQETFVKDTMTILNYFNLTHMMRNYSHIQNIEHQTVSQIEYTFYANNAQISYCQATYSLFAERLWHAFQLQGYIHRNSPMPKIEFSPIAKESMKLFKEAVIQEIYKNTISYREAASQKKTMMYAAYAQVPQSVIRQIQQVYEFDFKLFGYDKESYRP